MSKRKISTCFITCGICLDDYDATKLTALDGCTHMFCDSCITVWAKQKNSCPTCRRNFMYLQAPGEKKRRVENINKRHSINRMIIAYITDSTFRREFAHLCLDGDTFSCIMFEHVKIALPHLELQSRHIHHIYLHMLSAKDSMHRLAKIMDDTGV
jgi:hypothetical protein